ncbi:UDP-N-acetylmuramoyl-tripeptide--D-alanyl-D-alanine ligase [Nocardioides caeni]|uniref:UDP-N-acetylmuramoyl-tripeptide--D-alanyl-D-alanine ligase n=1 Tax=Nocardioides caeni TaxID=574700 RepID=A0A4V4HLJ8_9ACTN|nr:UDP-N-acetylmuramoyl-tripeptide--D-alanyl-D-alanine ligase [Nocardioides caeni]THV18546.1 UDP-N-acetylmuramoyl-tripeptide--D-alanyl-D-alanine ligase [Nocardioides caeni]
MIPLRLSEIAAVVGGELAGEDLTVTAPAYVDSRSPLPGGLFVAVVGERVDGHDFAEGSHAVLGSRPTTSPTVVVDDPVRALGLLARHVVDRLDVTVLAMTGSQGKTGTKDYLAAVLRTLAGETAVVATAGNNNNELGVPLTVLRATDTTRFLVVEMGARGIGHIAELCAIAPPRIAAVLNVGSAHVGEFGGKEAIAQAKGELVEALPADGVAILNAEDPLVAAMAQRTRARVVPFGQSADLGWNDLRQDRLGRPSFTFAHDGEEHPVSLQESGIHQVGNALAAAGMAIAAGFDAGEVAAALSTARSASRWRMEITERRDGLVLVNDAYNANPESMTAALEALSDIGAAARAAGERRRTIAVLGEMKELGDEHDEGHRLVGRTVAGLGIDVVVVVGDPARGIAEGASTGAGEVIVTAGREDAAAWLGQNAGPEDVVLVKASRGAALELVAEAILEESTA